jgi:hypothetical protein
MKEKIAINALKKLPFFGGLMAMALLSMALVGFIDSSVVLASAQDSKTIQISIVSDASRLSNLLTHIDKQYSDWPFFIEVLREFYPARDIGYFIKKPVTIDQLIRRVKSELE